MGTKQTPFQPDHAGRHTVPDSTGRAIANQSHGNMARSGNAQPGNIARHSTRGKHVYDVQVHGGMRSTTRSGGEAFGGAHKSALDALSGDAVVPGAIKSAPGYGNSGVQSGHPLAKAPGGKNFANNPPAFVPGQRSRVGETYDAGVGVHHYVAQALGHNHLHRLGSKIIEEGLRAAEPDHPGKLGLKP